MLNVGSQEILIVLVLVFLLFGPRHIPEVAQTLGKGIGELKRTLGGVEEGIRRTASELPDLSDPKAKLPTRPPAEEASKPRIDSEKPPDASETLGATRVPRTDGSKQSESDPPPENRDPEPPKEMDAS